MDDATITKMYESILNDMGLAALPREAKVAVLNAVGLIVRDRIVLEIIKTAPEERAQQLAVQAGTSDIRDVLKTLDFATESDIKRIDEAMRNEISLLVGRGNAG